MSDRPLNNALKSEGMRGLRFIAGGQQGDVPGEEFFDGFLDPRDIAATTRYDVNAGIVMDEREKDMFGGNVFMPPFFCVSDNRVKGQSQFFVNHSFSIVHFSGNLFLAAIS